MMTNRVSTVGALIIFILFPQIDFWRYPMSYPSSQLDPCDSNGAEQPNIFSAPPSASSSGIEYRAEVTEKRRSFADHLPPCHQRA